MSSNETIGAVPPPPGVVPNFDDPPSLALVSTATSIALAVFSTCFVALRFYTTLVITRVRGTADVLLALAWLLAVAFSVSACILPRFGFGRHLWDVPFTTYNIHFMKTGAIEGTFFGMSITFSKLSILAFYLNIALGPVAKRQRVAIYSLAVVVFLYGTLTSFEWLFACRPMEKYWDLTITDGTCINFMKIVLFNGVMNVVTDTAILCFPIWILWNLRLPVRQKIGVMGIMMTGGLVLAISIARAIMTRDILDSLDITWEWTPLFIATMFEVHIGLVCVCLIFAKPFFKRHFPKLLGSSYGAHSAPYGSRSRRWITQSDVDRYPLPSQDGNMVPLDNTFGNSLSQTAILDGASTKTTQEGQRTTVLENGTLS
ncbi:hypothetical protein F5883DRAFT_700776 [Diaporthe sp. PMI_573]|nr:hypothetical protein F5883DRAFT_700776 [Diaporthaceae sp. PMI_573]